MRILFQGDSITEMNRKAADFYDLGDGYVYYAAQGLREALPEKELEFINRGVGGDRTWEMKKRWQEQCIDLQPDFVSILIGVNDTWRAFDQNNPPRRGNTRTIIAPCWRMSAGIPRQKS